MTTETAHQIEKISKLLEEQGYAVIDFLEPDTLKALDAFFYDTFPESLPEDIFHSTMKASQADYRKMVDLKIKHLCAERAKHFLPNYKILFTNFLYKPVSSDSAVGIHQDWSYVDENQHTSYNIWTPLTELTEENGLFYILPGSHKAPLPQRSTPFSHELLDTYREIILANAQPVELKKGQAVIYHSGLIHFSKSNQSPNARLAIGMVCIPSDAQSLHLHRQNGSDKAEKFITDEEFYYTVDLDELQKAQYPVSGQKPAAEIKLEVNRQALDKWFNKIEHKATNAEEVAEYYDQFTAGYIETYGSTIQAFRPRDEKKLHQYVMNSSGMKKGMRILDAGCGVGGPALFFTKKLKVEIEGITASAKQVEVAHKRIKSKFWLKGKVNVQQGDFHYLSKHFDAESFDMVLFLESLGHAKNAEKVIKEAFKMLKKGGSVYIKDFFPFEIEDTEKQKRHQIVIDNINQSYTYNVLNLNKTLSALRKSGFEIEFIKKFDFIDDIEARAAFEEMFEIDLFGEMEEFRVAEWLEIKCTKPEYPLY